MPTTSRHDNYGELPVVILPDDVDIDELVAAGARASSHSVSAFPAATAHASVAALLPPVRRYVPPVDPAAEEVFADIDAEIEAEIDEELLDDADAQVSFQRVFRVTCWLLVGLVGFVAVIGWPYYTLGLSVKPFHHLHEALRPSGWVGLSLGIAGTLTMLASCLYLIRKRIASPRLGPLRGWLAFHIAAGLTGPALVLLHTNFTATSAVGLLASISMLVIVASGLFGRYVLVHMPHSLAGREFEVEELQQRLVVYRRKLENAGVNFDLLRPSGIAVATERPWWFPRPLGRFLDRRRGYRLALQRLRETLRAQGDPAVNVRRVLVMARRLYRERAWLTWYKQVRAAVAWWRFLHRWLAVTMLVVVTCHIGIALRFGGLWILRMSTWFTGGGT